MHWWGLRLHFLGQMFFIRLKICLTACLLMGAAPALCVAQNVAALHTPHTSQADFTYLEPYFETVGNIELIGDSVITALVQDDKGLLWMGTSKGLVQYDGYRFRRYTHHPQDPHSLVGEYIISMHFGKDGKLWIGTNSSGLSAFDPLTERFENFRHDPHNPESISEGRIWALADGADGGIWVATDHGLDFVAKVGAAVQHHRYQAGQKNGILDDRVRSLMRDKQGRLWIGFANGLQIMPKGSKAFTDLPEAPMQALQGQEVRSLLQAQDGKIWIGTRKQGVAWLDLSAAKAELHWLPLANEQQDGVSHPWIKAVVQTSAERIWVGTVGGGITVINAHDGRILQKLRRNTSISSGLAVDDLGALLLDQAGLLWIGTWGGGLQRHHGGNQAIRILRHGSGHGNALTLAEVRSVTELSNGQLLVGTYGNGIDIIDRQRGLVGGYRAAPKGNLPSANIMALAQTPDGTIWAGGQQQGVLRLLPGTKEWQVLGLERGLPGLQTRSFFVARNGDLWVGTTNGVARWQFGASKFETFLNPQNQLMASTVEAMAQGRDGEIWFASGHGLWRWQAGSRILQHSAYQIDRPASLASDDLRGVLVDANGQVWIGTPQGLDKMLHWDEKEARFEHVKPDTAQPMEPGENLLQDAKGRIWSSNFVYEPKTNQVILLSKADGYDIGTAWLGALARSQDGLFFYGGTLGLAIIDSAQFQPWNYQPPVVVSELKINGKANAIANLQEGLMLDPERRQFALEFAALDYSSPSKLHYRYRLQGYDPDWIETDANHRVASYSNLWPGQYLLQVRATNRMGQLSSRQLDVPIRVLPAFWQTGWFFFCAILLSLGLMYAAYSWRVARMRANARRLEQLIEARTADILRLAEIGQDLTATLDTEQAFARVYQQVKMRLDAHVFCIGLMNEEKDEIIFVYEMENGERMPTTTLKMSDKDRAAVWCIREQRELFICTGAQLLNYVQTILPPVVGQLMETVIYLPLWVEQEVFGCLTVQSPKQYAYNKDHLEFLRVLASYTAIALANSGAHTKLSRAHAELAAAHGHLKEAQAKLVHSEKMASLGGLVAGIAHEINTPLGTTLMAISGASQALEDLQNGFESGRVSKQQVEASIKDCIAYAALAFKTANRAANLITTFKAIAVSNTDIDLCEFDLSQYLKEMMNAVYRHLQPPGCDYQFEIPAQLPVRILQSALQEALTRLLDNVITHAFANGRIGTLYLRLALEADDIVALQLEDNGWGIAEEHLAHVFDPFFTTKGGDQGHVGLGLHVAYNHVRQGMKGEISIQSTLGQGTIVSLHFPRYALSATNPSKLPDADQAKLPG